MLNYYYLPTSMKKTKSFSNVMAIKVFENPKQLKGSKVGLSPA